MSDAINEDDGRPVVTLCEVINLIQIPCPCCNREVAITDTQTRRLNTQCQDDTKNNLTSCKPCFDSACAYYAEAFRDYYASVL